MYSGIPYGNYLDTPQCRVSVDNVRMKFSYKYKNYDFEKRQAVSSIDLYSILIDRFFFEGCDVKWSRCDYFKIGNYARTCTLSGMDPFSGEWSCAVMFGRYVFDSSCKQIAPEIVFDFNPNKVPDCWVSAILGRLHDGAKGVAITRYDVAFDFPVSRSDVTLLPSERQGYRLFRDPQNGVTEYQGERSSHNAMKLYDKTKESDLTTPVTRCEITVAGDYGKSLGDLFPVLTVLSDLQLELQHSELPFCVIACLLHPDLIPKLKESVDRKTWRKYKELIATNTQRQLVPDDWDKINRHIRSQLSRYKGVRL